MESGAMVLFRALVMLSCLVLIPMAAIFGSAFPNVIQSCLPDSWRGAVSSASGKASGEAPAYASTRSSIAAAQSSPAPQWPSAASAESRSATPTARSLAAAPVWPDATAAAITTVPVRRPSGPTSQSLGVNLSEKSTNAPPVFSAPIDMGDQRLRAATPSTKNSVSMSGAPPTTAGLNEHPSGGASAVSAWPSATSSNSPDASDRFTSIEQSLRSYGAVHYHLETWGQRGELYRFQCQMPASAVGVASPSFESVDSNALEAMQRVLDQVETLRTTARQ